jgi:proline-specific peptidase
MQVIIFVSDKALIVTSMTEGTLTFTKNGRTFSTWYKIFGTLSDRTKRPTAVLHGGPGLTHDYLIPLKDLFHAGRPVIFYDQIGNGKSSHAADEPTAFWTIDLMFDELVNLLCHFSIESNFDLVGNSWGGMLAMEYAVRRAPLGLKYLILSNSLARSHVGVERIEGSSGQGVPERRAGRLGSGFRRYPKDARGDENHGRRARIPAQAAAA